MVEISSDISCCGISEIDGIQDRRMTPQALLKQIKEEFFEEYTDYNGTWNPTINDYNYETRVKPVCRYLIFSDARDRKGTTHSVGQGLADLITKHSLGEVVSGVEHRNPNSYNWLKVWVWAVDDEKFKEWTPNRQPFRRPRNPLRKRG